ncbi:MAG: hypothetical protein HOM68_27470 [Gemmatimonadetes bacterium]|jgi:hypothetical protein|nr:hypothetical protein [Gemmatimonadota bacterium]MBT5145630.1 hypothetical protein [Gemmatimonadota bacterium]MBT5588140.1 hypothetical protein [Gemmatimonadota bacterium]MBT5960694.1 hypothetical protein [Gemmatimonadota bacterium]MBT6629772.1 hypothetical protein [Gemmatimonadota bacterium]
MTSIDWQTLAVYLLIGWSVVHLWRAFSPHGSETSGSCGGCAANAAGEGELMQIESAPNRK